VLTRSWNVFHGNTLPPGRRAYLERAVQLICEGEPAIVCLQELPAWALTRLESWTGMTAIGDVAHGPRLPGPLGRVITALHAGLFRSALTGQANAVLLAPPIRVLEHDVFVLNPGSLLNRGLKERRICQVLRLGADRRTLVLGHLHATNDPSVAAVEVARVAAHLDTLAQPSEPVVLAGDFNTHPELEDWGLAGGGPAIDHILVRGAPASPLEVWPEERRRHDGRLLSDHAPVELRLS
jgi:endonuclease/exonuclease/phosphatase family metal-dependent hydrolase